MPTAQPAAGEIVEGALRCTSCGRAYPVRRGIPRFVETGYADSFGLQWNRFRTEQLDSSNGTHLSAQRFWAETGWTPAWLAGKTVVEVGSGAGRFLEIASETAALVIGIDASGAVDAAKENLSGRSNVELVQASVYELPLREQSMDGCYCIGVIQHTPDPSRAVERLAAVLRPGGRVAVTCYEAKPWTRLNAKYLLRPYTTRLRPEQLLAGLGAAMKVVFPVSDVLFRLPVIGRGFRFALPVANYVDERALSRRQRYRWALMDTFDMLSPAYDVPQTFDTVATALRAGGVVDLQRLPNPGLNVVGAKSL